MKAKPRSPRRHADSGRGLFHRLTYSNNDDNSKLFQCRDGIAFCELAALLNELGYTYGTTVHFYPYDERSLAEYPSFNRSDLLVLATRPPLDDRDDRKQKAEEAASAAGEGKPKDRVKIRKRILKAKTKLEEALFTGFSKYFKHCTRKQVVLTSHAVRCLCPENQEDWRHLELYEYRLTGKYGASEVQYRTVAFAREPTNANHHSTIAFFLRMNNVPGPDCDCIASFGIDGYSTLIWNRLVRQRYPQWLESPCFHMAELIFKKEIPSRPLTPEFVDDGELVDVRLLTST